MSYWSGIKWNKLKRECPFDLNEITRLVKTAEVNLMNINKSTDETKGKLVVARGKIEMALREIVSWYSDESFLTSDRDIIIKMIMEECIDILLKRLDIVEENLTHFKDSEVTLTRLKIYERELELILYGEIYHPINYSIRISEKNKSKFLLTLFRIHADHFRSFNAPIREPKPGTKSSSSATKSYIPTLSELFEGAGEEILQKFYNKEILHKDIDDFPPYEQFLKKEGLWKQYKRWQKRKPMKDSEEDYEDDYEEDYEIDFEKPEKEKQYVTKTI